MRWFTRGRRDACLTLQLQLSIIFSVCHVTGAPPFRRLVYPLPEPNEAGLGVHATIDLAGQVKAGVFCGGRR